MERPRFRKVEGLETNAAEAECLEALNFGEDGPEQRAKDVKES